MQFHTLSANKDLQKKHKKPMLENETMLYLVLNTSSLENTLQSLQASDINYLIRRRNTSKYTRNDSFFILN